MEFRSYGSGYKAVSYVSHTVCVCVRLCTGVCVCVLVLLKSLIRGHMWRHDEGEEGLESHAQVPLSLHRVTFRAVDLF